MFRLGHKIKFNEFKTVTAVLHANILLYGFDTKLRRFKKDRLDHGLSVLATPA